jgi:hypothetical protein
MARMTFPNALGRVAGRVYLPVRGILLALCQRLTWWLSDFYVFVGRKKSKIQKQNLVI